MLDKRRQRETITGTKQLTVIPRCSGALCAAECPGDLSDPVGRRAPLLLTASVTDEVPRTRFARRGMTVGLLAGVAGPLPVAPVILTSSDRFAATSSIKEEEGV